MEYIVIKDIETANLPVILVLTMRESEAALIQELRNRGITEKCVLVLVSGFDWNRDLSPWEAENVFRGGGDFGGKADEFLQELLTRVLKPVKGSLETVPWFGIAGYSLAGLFAIYSLYRCDRFSRAVSASGSFWFDGFVDYTKTHSLAVDPERVYLSLGDKEHKTKNKRMAEVFECTQVMENHLESLGIETMFEIN